MALKLDFSGLDSIATAQRPQEAHRGDLTPEAGKSTLESLKRKPEPTGEPERQELEGSAHNRLLAEQETHQRYVEAYSEYQKNIKACSQLQPEILKGVKAGEDPTTLLLKACEAIALMTGNQLFYSQVEEDLKAIYGEGLLEPAPLQKQLEEVEERERKLAEALEREETGADSRSRIERAIQAHRQREHDLRELLEKAG